MITLPRFISVLMLVSGLSLSASAQKAESEKEMSPEERGAAIRKKIESFGWTRTGKGRLGSAANIEIPSGYRFTGGAGTKKMLEFTGNIAGENELGVIAPENLGWWVLFEFENSGYVKDSDKDKLDADAILKDLKKGQEAANEARAEKGLTKLYLDGWAVPPRYNDQTHNLEWAIKLHDDEGQTSVNYLTKLLGREGVMHVTLLVSPEELQSTLPTYQKLLAGYSYQPGKTYAEYRQGDKVAQYTLAGLITVGAGAALLKSGWLAKLGLIFAKFGKAAIAGVIALFAGLKRVFFRLFGKNDNS